MNGININLTITSPDLHDAFLALAEAINRYSGAMPAPEAVPAPAEKPAEVKQMKAKDPEPAAAPPVEPETVQITLEDVRKTAMEKSRKDKTAVKAAITEVGAAKVTDVDPTKYPQFMALLEAI